MRIETVNQGVTKHRKPLRVGRGKGAGQGKLCGRGQDGHKSRSGYSRHPGMVGEDLPMIRRIPKRGFNNPYAETVVALNVADLSAAFQAGEEVTPATLEEKGLLKQRYDQIKILGDGEIDKALKVSVHRFSGAAESKIVAAGGTVTRLRAKRTVREKNREKLAEQKKSKS